MVWIWILKISPKNVKFFNFFPFRSKKLLRVGSESTQVEAGSASYLLRVKSKLGSGQGPSLKCTKKVKLSIFITLSITNFYFINDSWGILKFEIINEDCTNNSEIIIIVFDQIPQTTIFLVFIAQSLFKQAWFVYPSMLGNASHSKQAAMFSSLQLLSRRFSFTILQEVRYFLICFSIKIFSRSISLSAFCI